MYALFCNHIFQIKYKESRSQWPRGLRLRSTAARLLRSWVRIPPGVWMSVCCECCVLSGRGLCDELITRPDKSYRLWCVVVCDHEKQKKTLCMRRPKTHYGVIAPIENKSSVSQNIVIKHSKPNLSQYQLAHQNLVHNGLE